MRSLFKPSSSTQREREWRSTYAAAVSALLSRHVFSDAVLTRVAANLHGDSSGVRGAAWLWSMRPLCKW